MRTQPQNADPAPVFIRSGLLPQDTFDEGSVSLSFEELMEMLQRNTHLVPTVKPKCVPLRHASRSPQSGRMPRRLQWRNTSSAGSRLSESHCAPMLCRVGEGKPMKPSVFKKAGDMLLRYYKKVRYARFVPFYILIWTAFGANTASPRLPVSAF